MHVNEIENIRTAQISKIGKILIVVRKKPLSCEKGGVEQRKQPKRCIISSFGQLGTIDN